MVPTQIHMGRGFWSDVLMLGIMMGFRPIEAYTHKEMEIEMVVK
jgi:hypothetical protein